jgi:predicted transcriptional regulator
MGSWQTHGVQLSAFGSRRNRKSGWRGWLIADAVEAYVSDQERTLAEVRQADRQVESGLSIKNEDMEGLALIVGHASRAAGSGCACGKKRDDEMLCP